LPLRRQYKTAARSGRNVFDGLAFSNSAGIEARHVGDRGLSAGDAEIPA
jgi:hypothetical protein